MSRRSRYEEAGAIHHVVVQGLDRRAIVADDRDRERLAARVREATARYGWEMLADCRLDTHAHLLLRTPEPNLGLGVGWIQGGYAREFRVRHGGEGPLFWPRYWSRRVVDERGLLLAALYVDLNPVAAGIVAHPSQYRWCSYGRPRPWLVGVLGADLATATAVYAEIVDASCRRLRSARLPDVVDAQVSAAFPRRPKA